MNSTPPQARARIFLSRMHIASFSFLLSNVWMLMFAITMYAVAHQIQRPSGKGVLQLYRAGKGTLFGTDHYPAGNSFTAGPSMARRLRQNITHNGIIRDPRKIYCGIFVREGARKGTRLQMHWGSGHASLMISPRLVAKLNYLIYADSCAQFLMTPQAAQAQTRVG